VPTKHGASLRRGSVMNPDPELEAVFASITSADPTRERMAAVLRATFDQLYDGQHTGRYRIDQLRKTEKTHCGTLVEINLHREFEFADGIVLDYRIAGHEVDCKFSLSEFGWMIPPEAIGHLCLLVWADEQLAKWSAGLFRVSAELLTKPNRDQKGSLTAAARENIHWIARRADLPPNVLFHAPPEVVAKIFSHASGTKRTDELFRLLQRQRIGRGVVAAVAQQEDYMRRIRGGNGGARLALQGEGIVIFGQFTVHVAIAEALGVPKPGPGESVSCRVVSTQSGDGAIIDGKLWRLADPWDPVEAAPILPMP
jgi:hypothetical protein